MANKSEDVLLTNKDKYVYLIFLVLIFIPTIFGQLLYAWQVGSFLSFTPLGILASWFIGAIGIGFLVAVFAAVLDIYDEITD